MRAWVRMLGLVIAAFVLLGAGAVMGLSSRETLPRLLAAALLLAAVGVIRAAAPETVRRSGS